MLSIGELSRATGLTIKTIRLYHEKGLLTPAWIDGETGYRYFGRADLERARIVRLLRELDFPLAEIRELLENESDEGGVVALLERQRQRIRDRQADLKRISRSLDAVIAREREAWTMAEHMTFEIEEKELAPLRVAGLRWRGRYADTGEALQRLCRQVGRHARGKPFNLYFDADVKEEDADVESCIPIGSASPQERDGIVVHELPGGRCMSLVHQGPYEEIHRGYARLLSHLQDQGIKARLPYREIYVKGPGMIFRGNPRSYLTEIQILVG